MKNLKNYSAIFIVLVFFDRFSKYLVFNYFQKFKINQFLSIEMTINRGISFGILNYDNSILFIILSILILILILTFGFHTLILLKKNKEIIFETILLAGAISNFIDRIIYFGIIDFIFFKFKNLSFPIFNLADIFIFFGIFSILFFNKND